MLNWIVGIPLITLLGSSALAITIIPSSRDESARSTLKGLVGLICLWTFSSLMYHIIDTPSTLFWFYLILICAMYTGALGLHFCVQYTGFHRKITKFLVPATYITMFLLTIALLAGKLAISANLLPNGAVEAEFGPLAPAMWGTITIFTLIGLTILISRFFKSRISRSRYAILPIIGFIILASGGLSNLIVREYPVDIAANFVFICLLAYSVVSSHVLKPPVHESWRFSIPGIVIILAIFYTGLFTFFTKILGLQAAASHISAGMASAVLLVATFEPLRTLYAGRLLTFIYPYTHRYYLALNKLTGADSSLVRWGSSTATILDVIMTATNAKGAALLVRNDKLQCFETLQELDRQGSYISLPTMTKDNPLITVLSEGNIALTLQEIEQHLENEGIPGFTGQRRELYENGLFCGIQGHDGLIGVMAVSRNSISPRNEDRDFLELACRQAAPIVENYLLYQTSQRELFERRRIQEYLQRSEAKYRALVENADDYIFMLDGEFRVISMNESAGRILGGGHDELTGKKVTELFPKQFSDKYIKSLKEVLETGKPILRDSTIVSEGQEIPINTLLSPVKDSDGNVFAVIGVSRDMSGHRQMEEQLLHSQVLASLGQMTAGIAHEVGNPLASILLYSEDIVRNNDIPGQINKDLKVIRSEAMRASKLMKDLLTYSRKLEPKMRPLNVNNVVEKVIEMVRYQLNVANIELTEDLAQEAIIARGNSSQLTQVFLNLILNAEEALKESGRGQIHVCSKTDGKYITISVSDNGPGIPEANLDRIFLPFFTTKAVGGGTGLGLSTCYGIVTAHKGRLTAENNKTGGATFTVRLPLVEARDRSRKEPVKQQT